MLKIGDEAPEITLHTDTGEDFRLSGLKGNHRVCNQLLSPDRQERALHTLFRTC